MIKDLSDGLETSCENQCFWSIFGAYCNTKKFQTCDFHRTVHSQGCGSLICAYFSPLYRTLLKSTSQYTWFFSPPPPHFMFTTTLQGRVDWVIGHSVSFMTEWGFERCCLQCCSMHKPLHHTRFCVEIMWIPEDLPSTQTLDSTGS